MVKVVKQTLITNCGMAIESIKSRKDRAFNHFSQYDISTELFLFPEKKLSKGKFMMSSKNFWDTWKKTKIINEKTTSKILLKRESSLKKRRKNPTRDIQNHQLLGNCQNWISTLFKWLCMVVRWFVQQQLVSYQFILKTKQVLFTGEIWIVRLQMVLMEKFFTETNKRYHSGKKSKPMEKTTI